MADDINPIAQTPPRAVIVLTWNQNGSVSVSFPNDEVAGRFLLDKGASEIRAAYAARNAPMIQPANGQALPPVSGPRRMLG